MNKGFLKVVFIFHCFYIHAQYNFDVDHLGEITNNLEYERLMTDREYQVLSAFVAHATVPVFSMEGAVEHPLQALADAETPVRSFSSSAEGIDLRVTFDYE